MTDIPAWGDRRRIRVGLLGGSFNPVHEGHLHVAHLARRRLRLDQVWLLVSPGNPLKPVAGMAPFAARLAAVRQATDGRRILASGIEAKLGTRFTLDTIRVLRQRFPRVDFVWVMGADILEQLPRWRRWEELAQAVTFAVLPRPTYNPRALAGKAAHRLRGVRLAARSAAVLPARTPPCWTFLLAPQHAASATAIRARSLPSPATTLHSGA